MTVTETPPVTDTVAATNRDDDAPDPLSGVAAVIATGQHKTIGRLYLFTALVFAIAALVLGVLVAFEQVDTSGVDIFGGAEAYVQMVILFRFSMVFMVVVPLFIGLATYITPLQVGAPSVAFPRAAAAAYWTWLVSSGIFVGAFLADGGFIAGGDAESVELALLAFGGLIASLLVATTTVLTTIVSQRAEGMTLDRIPLFSWSMLVAGAMWLFTLPVLIADIALSWVDLRGETALFFDPGVDGFGSYPYLSWVLDQPQVFAFAIPIVGVVAELVPIAAARRQALNGLMMGAIAALGLLTFGAYAQPVFNATVASEPVYIVQMMLLVLPIVIMAGGWAFTLRGGAPMASLPLGIAGGALVMLIAAAGVAALRVLGGLVGGLSELDDWGWVDDFREPFDDLAGTAIVASLFYYVVFAGLIAAVAGLRHWGPKMFGRRLNPALGSLAGLALIGGTVLAALPEAVNGFLDEPDFLASGTVDDGVEVMNLISAIGLVIVLLGVVLLLVDVFSSIVLGRGDLAGDDPWGGQTLEWATTSPPPATNFDSAPKVSSERPLLDADDTGDADVDDTDADDTNSDDTVDDGAS